MENSFSFTSYKSCSVLEEKKSYATLIFVQYFRMIFYDRNSIK